MRDRVLDLAGGGAVAEVPGEVGEDHAIAVRHQVTERPRRQNSRRDWGDGGQRHRPASPVAKVSIEQLARAGRGDSPQGVGAAQIGDVVRLIVGEVAALAPSAQILVTGTIRIMVDVADRQHDRRAGDGVRLSVQLGAASAVIMAALALAFASSTGALKADAPADLGPVGRITSSVFRSDWHVRRPRVRAFE